MGGFASEVMGLKFNEILFIFITSTTFLDFSSHLN